MNLRESANLNWCKLVRVTMTDGELQMGKLVGYTSALDNEPDPESITLEKERGMLVELYADEIAAVVTDG